MQQGKRGARVAEWGPPLAGRIGVHLQLTQGRPCCRGERRSRRSSIPKALFRTRPPESSASTWAKFALSGARRIDRLRSWGFEPSHLDSFRRHVGLKPHIVSAYIAVAVAAGLPARTNSPQLSATLAELAEPVVDLSTTAWYDGTLTEKRLLRVIEEAFDRLSGVGTIEVMCGRWLCRRRSRGQVELVRQREAEPGVLTSDKLKNGLSKLDVEVGSMDRVAA